MRRCVAWLLCALLALTVLSWPGTGLAQGADVPATPGRVTEGGDEAGIAPALALFTPYAAQVRAIEDSDAIVLDLLLKAAMPVVAQLQIVEAASGWEAVLNSSDGVIIAAMYAGPEADGIARLLLRRPPDAQPGRYHFVLRATAGALASELPIDIELRNKPADALSLAANFTMLSGRRSSILRYNLTLRNEGEEDTRVSLVIESPPGLETALKVKGQEVKHTILPAGAATTLNVESRVLIDCTAGDHTLVVRAFAGTAEVEQRLTARIIGAPILSLTGPTAARDNDTAANRASGAALTEGGGAASGDARRISAPISGLAGVLAGRASADRPASFTLTVRNGGSAEAHNVRMTSTRPSDWSVTFVPEVIEQINIGQEVNVVATVRPSARTMAGDYMVILAARAEDSDPKTIGLRVTVPSVSFWRWIGISLAALFVWGGGQAIARARRREELANG